jgi:hypothetical protein
VDGADVGMRERRRSPRLVKQMLAASVIKARILINHLYCHVTVKDFVIGAIHNAHSSFPDLRDDTAVTENSANHSSLLPAPATLLTLRCPTAEPSI